VECQRFDFPCTWGKFEFTFVIFQRSALTIRLDADGLGVRSCPISRVRVFPGIGSEIPPCLRVFEGLVEPSPPQNTPSASGTLWAYATCVPWSQTQPVLMQGGSARNQKLFPAFLGNLNASSGF